MDKEKKNLDFMPHSPHKVYKEKWKGIKYFLGTKDRVYRSYKEAKNFIRSFNLKSNNEWKEYCRSGKKPKDIPASPYQVYKDKGWISWGDFLGTGRFDSKKCLSYEEAKVFVRHLKLKNTKDWKEYCKSGKKPNNVPNTPHLVYKDKGWINYGDWLGTGVIASFNRVYLSYEESKKFVHGLKLKGKKEWFEYCKLNQKPENIPIGAYGVYRDKGWKGWGDFLGTAYVACKDRAFLEFEDAKKFVHKLKLKSTKEWRKYSKSGKRPDDIPGNPNKVYKDKGWCGIGDWLGNKRKKGFLSFEEARELVRKLGLKNTKEWQYYSKNKRPDDIPSLPNVTYKNKGWKNMGDWLGTGVVACKYRVYRSYEEAKKFVYSLKFKSQKEWCQYRKSGKRPDDIPSDAQQFYKNKGWKGLKDFLGY